MLFKNMSERESRGEVVMVVERRLTKVGLGGGVEAGTVWIWEERGVCALGGECNRSKNGRN